METTRDTESAKLTASGVAAVIAGAGAVTFALFPLAIPFLLLTAVFTAPLVLIGVAAALPLGIVAAAVLAIRVIARRVRRRPGAGPRPEPVVSRARSAGGAHQAWSG